MAAIHTLGVKGYLDMELKPVPRPVAEMQLRMPEAAAATTELDAAIVEKAKNIQAKRRPDRAAALRFYQGVADLDQLTDKERGARVEQLCADLIQAAGYDMDEVHAHAKMAGQWSNIHQWMPDVVSATPQMVDAILLGCGVAPLARALTNLGLAGSVQLGAPFLGVFYIQPMLELQRMNRGLTSIKYGTAAVPGPSYDKMCEETHAINRLLNQAGAKDANVDATSLETKLEEVEGAYKTYMKNQGGLLQRRTLNMPESIVRSIRASIFAAAIWINFAVTRQNPNTRIPVVLLVQFLGTAVAWLLHAFIAGPARDNRIRDEQLKVDIAADGPGMAKALVARQTGQAAQAEITAASIQDVDQEAMEALQAMVKDRNVVLQGNAATLFKAERSRIFEGMSRLLALPVPVVAEYHLSVSATALEQRTDAERALANRVEGKMQALRGTKLESHDKKLQTLRSVTEDIARLQNPDDWVAIAPERKRVLDAVIVDRPSSMSFSQIFQYLFKGVSSTDDMVRVAHSLAQDIRSDWRRFSPDAHYKIGKATQVTGMGSSSFPFLVGSLFRIIEAVGGHVPLGWKIGLSAGPLAVYVLGGERYSGELVNEVIAMRQKMMAKYPYGRAPSGHRRLLDLRTFGSNFVLVPKAIYQDVTRRYGSVQAKNAIEAARTKVRQLQGVESV